MRARSGDHEEALSTQLGCKLPEWRPAADAPPVDTSHLPSPRALPSPTAPDVGGVQPPDTRADDEDYDSDSDSPKLVRTTINLCSPQ